MSERFGADGPPEPPRRRLLKRAGMAGLGAAVAARTGWALPQPAEGEVVPFIDVPEEFNPRRGGNVTGLDLRELRHWLTPTEDLFAVQHYNRPELDGAAWRLRLLGELAEPLTLTLDDVRRRPRVERTVTFECSGNRAARYHGMVGNATWAGTPLAALLREAAPRPEAIEVIFWGADRGKEKIRDNEYEQDFARSMSLAEALAADAILAYEVNGRPLTARHGFPLRLVVPGWYGIANVKWLQRIELSDRRLMNRFMGRDYVTIIGRESEGRSEWFERSVTRQRVKSAIARVTRSGDLFRVFGYALSDGTPLRSVEVRVDDGRWQRASLDERGNPFAWTFFSLETPALPAGEHTLASRATDAKGRTQPEDLSHKKTYWEDNAQFKRTIRVG